MLKRFVGCHVANQTEWITAGFSPRATRLRPPVWNGTWAVLRGVNGGACDSSDPEGHLQLEGESDHSPASLGKQKSLPSLKTETKTRGSQPGPPGGSRSLRSEVRGSVGAAALVPRVPPRV